MKKTATLMLTIFYLVSLSACNNDGPKTSGLALLQTTHPSPTILSENKDKEMDVAKDVEREISKFKELYDVAVIKKDKEMLVAYKVKHLQRFRMKQIEKKMTKLLEEKYPKYTFIVSSDYKIFLEAVELHESMKNPNYSKKKAKERFDRIVKLRNELT
ncbi:sporulation protein [Bacillus sp. 31A1R]|uniref:Sporulation protein n=1 Tax=Robertmurraya mangrovi TaxID=3098077 RepID=A0ABU5ITC7_9BACI|nr:YhcN/YlaJ family sporulation lipoprotein [Bacillus sp. 31A1R]MDZ5470376.1 sporulation protein [Bacillus sp. 31A1R]